MPTRIQAPINATTRLPQKPKVASGTSRFRSNPPIKAPTSPMITSPSRPNPRPGMITPANQPAIKPITSQAIIPPGFKAAANTSVASNILHPFLLQKQQWIPSPSGSLQKRCLGEKRHQQRLRHSGRDDRATSYTREGAKWMQVNSRRPWLLCLYELPRQKKRLPGNDPRKRLFKGRQSLSELKCAPLAITVPPPIIDGV